MTKLRIGSLVFATNQGLGVLAKDFYAHGVVTDVMVVLHGKHQNNLDWYPGAEVVGSLTRDKAKMEKFCEGLDVMLFFETPFSWDLIDHCRKVGVKTVVSVMHEMMPSLDRAVPDAWLCPSLLDVRWAHSRPRNVAGPHPAVEFIPVPVEVPWKRRQEVSPKVFVHNGGNLSFKDRNGTQLLLSALPMVEEPITVILRSQKPVEGTRHGVTKVGKVTLDCRGPAPWETLYDEGDAFVFVEKWNGLCLPLQEARAAGMLVIAGDRFPVNEWLPRATLVRPSGYSTCRVLRGFSEVEEATYDPRDLAAMINLAARSDWTGNAASGKAWAEGMSWASLGPKYKAFLEGMLA